MGAISSRTIRPSSRLRPGAMRELIAAMLTPAWTVAEIWTEVPMPKTSFMKNDCSASIRVMGIATAGFDASPDAFAQLALSIIDNSLLNGEVIRLDGGWRLPFQPGTPA